MSEPRTDEFPTLVRLGSHLAELELERQSKTSRDRRARPSRLAKLALASLAVAGVLISPPGQAVAEWMGDLIGVGEIGGPPSSDEQRPSGPPASEVIVFANGETPTGERFEVVAYRSDDIEGVPAENTFSGICVRTEFPDRVGQGSRDGGVQLGSPGAGGVQIGLPAGFCYAGAPTEQGINLGSTSGAPGDGGLITVTGEANAETGRIVVTYTDRSGEPQSVDAAVAHLGGQLGRRIGVPSVTEPTTYFIAFLPDASDEEIEATAYDAEGSELASGSISPPASRGPSGGWLKRFDEICDASSSRRKSFCNAQEQQRPVALLILSGTLSWPGSPAPRRWSRQFALTPHRS